MHQAFQDRFVELGVLLQRSRAARAEFSKRTDRVVPGSKVRFQVLSKARGSYSVVELTTGALSGVFNNWKEAVNFAQHLETQPALTTAMGLDSRTVRRIAKESEICLAQPT